MSTSQLTNKMEANEANLNWQFTMYRQFCNVNTGNTINIFDEGGEGDVHGAWET